ncbi:hypothetical protein FACS189426_21750 [Bacteroidia bacterium]|nr:hypothetical protein FACS189426_21750 [Bacteroidia bacterium]GHT83930.1 hypothetical protein FACS18947_0550 [Bacteroidia bacterium]
MLKKILSIPGRPGLFKLISKGKNMFIAESMIDQKRIPVYSKDKVVSLGDIGIYTDDEEAPLAQIFTSIKQKENGEKIAISPSIKPEELRAYFAEVLPNFDKERVYPSDIKKIMNWYNLLINSGFTEFDKKEESENTEENKTNETKNEGE